MQTIENAITKVIWNKFAIPNAKQRIIQSIPFLNHQLVLTPIEYPLYNIPLSVNTIYC